MYGIYNVLIVTTVIIVVIVLYIITITFNIDSVSTIGVLLLAMSEMSKTRHSSCILDSGPAVEGRMLHSWN